MYAGIQDNTAVLRDSRWTRDQITHTLVHYEEINADHLSFTIGKDMSYFTEGVMGLLDRYHSNFKDSEKKSDEDDLNLLNWDYHEIESIFMVSKSKQGFKLRAKFQFKLKILN